MRTATASGHRALRMLVRKRSDTFTIERPTQTTGAMGGTTSTSSHQADLFVYSPREANVDTEYGDRLTGSLALLALPAVDLEVGDRLDYQGVPYEIAEIITADSESGDTLVRASLTRRANDS